MLVRAHVVARACDLACRLVCRVGQNCIGLGIMQYGTYAVLNWGGGPYPYCLPNQFVTGSDLLVCCLFAVPLPD